METSLQQLMPLCCCQDPTLEELADVVIGPLVETGPTESDAENKKEGGKFDPCLKIIQRNVGL